MQIAIDGPAGSGKSTISRIVAQKYNLIYLDTGAMYRSAAWISLKHSIPVGKLGKFLVNVDFLFTNNGNSLNLIYKLDDELINICVDDFIRSLEVSGYVSEIAANPAVREVLTDKQRTISKGGNVILDGRDIGTVVLPHADLKFFLTADPKVRAQRRTKELQDKGKSVTYEEVYADILHRDKLDSTRKVSPLLKAEDAVEINTTSLTIEQVVEIIGVAVTRFRDVEEV